MIYVVIIPMLISEPSPVDGRRSQMVGRGWPEVSLSTETLESLAEAVEQR